MWSSRQNVLRCLDIFVDFIWGWKVELGRKLRELHKLESFHEKKICSQVYTEEMRKKDEILKI